MNLTELLQLANTVLEAAIVILISSVLLYGIEASLRSAVARASNLLLAFTVVAYFGDLQLTQVANPAEIERWLRIEWLGIAFVPSAYLQLSNALLVLSGRSIRGTRRLAVWAAYLFSALTLALSALTDLVIRGQVINLAAPQLRPGPLFPVFVVLFGGFITLGAIWQVRARRQSRTATMRRRIAYLAASAGGPVISVFPFLVFTGQSASFPPALFWLIQIIGNTAVGITIFFMTYSVAYFGVNEPDRVVRLRLIKFLARGPLVAFGVLVLLVMVGRAGRFLGIPAERATPFVIVSGIVIFQWIILLIKPRLERWFYFGERDQVVRIQELRDRVLTPSDIRQLLESILANVCALLQVETAFIASFTAAGVPQVELIFGDLGLANGDPADDWQALKRDLHLGLPQDGDHFVWNGYWVFSLYDRGHGRVLGILGVQAPTASGVAAETGQALAQLTQQAAAALEDRILQQEVFAAMEGLLLRMEAAQIQRGHRLYADSTVASQAEPAQDEEFTGMVRDALSHYWGGPKLTQSPLLQLQVVRQEAVQHQGSSINAMRAVLLEAIESLRPEGQRSLTTGEWILYNILELKFLKRYRVRDVARRLAMSESDLYRKQRVAIEAVARAIVEMEQDAKHDAPSLAHSSDRNTNGNKKVQAKQSETDQRQA